MMLITKLHLLIMLLLMDAANKKWYGHAFMLSVINIQPPVSCFTRLVYYVVCKQSTYLVQKESADHVLPLTAVPPRFLVVLVARLHHAIIYTKGVSC
ncbi:hypothetical protein Hanom_Chr09g00810681 [Helianthus anomalus]